MCFSKIQQTMQYLIEVITLDESNLLLKMFIFYYMNLFFNSCFNGFVTDWKTSQSLQWDLDI